MKIEALHEFDKEEAAAEWADRFVPTAPRIDLFTTILENIGRKEGPNTKVLELGIGPGYLANFILERRNDINYEGLDFSKPMLNIAKQRLAAFEERLTLSQADLTSNNWRNRLSVQPDAVVSTWALHDLLSKENILHVYQTVYDFLPEHGILLNGDFIKPETSTFSYEAGRIKPSEHLELLNRVGFSSVVCVKEFEMNVEQPTTANNYACFKAVK